MFFIALFETTHDREQLDKVLKKIVRQLLFLRNHLKFKIPGGTFLWGGGGGI